MTQTRHRIATALVGVYILTGMLALVAPGAAPMLFAIAGAALVSAWLLVIMDRFQSFPGSAMALSIGTLLVSVGLFYLLIAS